MKVCTISAVLIMSLTMVISLSTIVAMSVEVDKRLDRIDFHYSSVDRDQSPVKPAEPVFVKTLEGPTVGGATLMKNQIKGPADMGVYYINSAGRNCGGLSTSQCSKSCGGLGYPVYWCYATVCYCHYGSSTVEETNEIEVPTI